jgi:hypothetical protein
MSLAGKSSQSVPQRPASPKSTKLEASYLGLESIFKFTPLEKWMQFHWSIDKLGGPFPGGDWLVKDPVIEFHAEGKPPVRVEMIQAATRPEMTICGITCFRRMRGLQMPDYPMNFGVELPAGRYRVRFTAELFDCRRLVQYCDAMQFFAGYFNEMVAAFEEHAKMWYEKNHAEAGEPFRFPCDLNLGELVVDRDLTQMPYYVLSNEAVLPRVSWDPAPPRAIETARSASALRPAVYWSEQIGAGVKQLHQYGFCRYGTHCNEAPGGRGSWGAGDRSFQMWGHTFTMQYAMSGDANVGEAAWYCARMLRELTRQHPEPHRLHCLSFGMNTMMMIRLARLVERPELLELAVPAWKQWPYDEKRHNFATQPAADGGDQTPNDTYNMKMIGATAAWMLGKYMGDNELMAKGRDSVMNFILPAIQPAGYWLYRPGSPEGKIINGIMANNHYDGFVKTTLAELLMHDEWRAEKGVMQTLRRGVDFVLQNLVDQNERTLRFELHSGANYGPHEAMAKYLGHAGMYAGPLSLLALHEDKKYLEPLRKSMQFVYDQRDLPLMRDYWDNCWLFSCYSNMLELSRRGLEFGGTAERLTLTGGKIVRPLM